MKLFGIKNCDSVKKARKWLDANEVAYEFHDFKQAAPAKSQLQHWLEVCGWETLLNRRGLTWRQLSDKQKQNVDAQKALQLMLEYPMLIKRPVIEHDAGVMVGFKEADFQQHFG